MTDRPIIFSAPMVQALLEGRKTQTRRVLKPQPFVDPSGNFCSPNRKGGFACWGQHTDGRPHIESFVKWRVRFAVGDRLWVRETFCLVRESLDYETGGEYSAYDWEDELGDPRARLGLCGRGCTGSAVYFPADGEDGTPSEMWPLYGLRGELLYPKGIRWRSPIHMPRWASRLTLNVTGVRVERLQDVSEADALAEGLIPGPGGWWSGAEGQAGTTPQAAYALLWNSLHGHGAWSANPWVTAITFSVERANIDSLPARAAA